MATNSDIASMLMQQETEQQEPEHKEQPTGFTDEQPETEAQTDEAEYDEAESDGDLEDDDEGEAQEALEKRIAKVNGEEFEVTFDEAVAGYQRDADYRKGTMANAEERKALAAQFEQVNSTLAELKSFIKSEEDSVDWDDLQESDPKEYIRRKKDLEQAKATQAKAQDLQQTERAKLLDAESKRLIEVMGGDQSWTHDQRTKDMELTTKYMVDKGFSEQELGSIIDHRVWRVLFDAAKSEQFSKNQTKVKDQVRQAPKSVKPGQKVPASQRKMQTARKNLAASTKHNSTENLAELLKLHQ